MKRKMCIVLLVISLMILFLSGCKEKEKAISIPIPDESQVVIDEVTLEQIEERANELELKYCEMYGLMEYEDILILLVAANYEYLSEDAWQQWQEEKMNYNDGKIGVCSDYISWSVSTWDFVYDVNQRGNGSSFERRPRLAELFFDDDLIEQAEFVDRQLYNYAYQRDEHAMYNLTSYVLSEEHPLTTELAPFHYDGETMSGGSGYLINSVARDAYMYIIHRYESMDGYIDETTVFHIAPDSSVLFKRD